MKHSLLTILAGSAVLAVFALPQSAFAADACDTIAKAKVAQWQQPKIRRTRDLTMADGTKKTDDVIVTLNTMYFQAHGRWFSGQMTLHDRGVPSTASLQDRLSLTDCQESGHDTEAGQAVTVYTYRSTSDDFNASLKIWIADASGLPLRAEMQNTAPKGEQASLIAAHYVYGADVHVPGGAQLADFRRRYYWKQRLEGAQAGEGFK